jgi:hypothetical protein
MDNVREAVTLTAENGQVEFENGTVFFVGTATVLLHYAGFSILTITLFLSHRWRLLRRR